MRTSDLEFRKSERLTEAQQRSLVCVTAVTAVWSLGEDEVRRKGQHDEFGQERSLDLEASLPP